MMRWFWIDRFLEFEAGRRALAVKNVTLCEPHLEGHCPGLPLLPPSLMIEGMAQTGGLLVSQLSDFKARVVLAKVGRANFQQVARPGDQMTYEVTLQDATIDGAMVHGTIARNGEPVGNIELMFAQLDNRFEGVELFYPADFLKMLRLLRIFDVGTMPNGDRIRIPSHLEEAESRVVSEFQINPH